MGYIKLSILWMGLGGLHQAVYSVDGGYIKLTCKGHGLLCMTALTVVVLVGKTIGTSLQHSRGY